MCVCAHNWAERCVVMMNAAHTLCGLPLTVHMLQTDELEAEVATKEKRLLALNKRLEDLQEEHSALRAELVTVRIQRDAEREVLHQFAVSLHDRYGLGGELVTELRRETEKEAGSGEGAGDGSAGRGVPLAQVIAAVEKVIARERARGDDLEQGLTAARRRVRELEELDEVRKSQMEHQVRGAGRPWSTSVAPVLTRSPGTSLLGEEEGRRIQDWRPLARLEGRLRFAASP